MEKVSVTSIVIPNTKLEAITEEEVNTIKQDIEAKRSDSVNLIKLLKILQKKQLTYDLLAKTKLGKTIKNISTTNKDIQSKDDLEVKSICNELIKVWKDTCKQTKKEKEEKKEALKTAAFEKPIQK
jgi:hypothetical protein